jgi:fatty acid desaturase
MTDSSTPLVLDALATLSPGRMRRFFTAMIVDPRDWTFVRLTLLMTATVPLAAGLLFVPAVFRWWLAPVYLAALIYFWMDRYVLMLHATSHRKLFNKRYAALNHFIPWALGPFFGQTPGTYFVHHMGMHHPENNLGPDLSSTMRYQRDSFRSFLAYWARFFFFGVFELFGYLVKRRRYTLLRRFLVGEAYFYLLVAGLMWVNWQATVTVLVLPFVIVRWAMMGGNWAQHAFVDAADPANPYRNSITLINARHNRRCFNDGYHAVHHLRPTTHWTEMPLDFEKDPARYAREGAVVFTGLQGFQHVWILLMLRRYDRLAEHFVQPIEGALDRDAIIALLKRRTARIAA